MTAPGTQIWIGWMRNFHMEKNMNQKLDKGTYGYLDRNKIHAWKRAALMLSVPVFIFLAAWIVKGTRENVMTVVAIVGCLPGCNQVVRAIIASRYHSTEHTFYEKVEEERGELRVLYELVFTSYEQNYYIDSIAVSGREVIGYSSDPKLDAGRAAEHIRTMLKKGSYKQDVKIVKDPKAYLGQIRRLREKAPEAVPFHGDDRYPGFTRDEIILDLLMSVSL